MDEPGQRLKHARERLDLRYRDVEAASNQIATKHNNAEFVINISRLSDIENRGTVPTIFRLYSLCTIYRLDLHEVLEWYGVNLSGQAADAAGIEIKGTHPIGFGTRPHGDVLVPLSLDPGLDIKKTTFLSQMIQRWGTLPISLLGTEGKHLRFAFMGSDDWSMYPLIRPESLLLIDETRRKIAASGWNDEFERPIYFIEHRTGYFVGWCTSNEEHLIVLPHPASTSQPRIFLIGEVDVIGQVTGVAMHLDGAKRRNTPA